MKTQHVLLFACALFFTCGCGGPTLLKPRGKVLKDGQPLVPAEGEILRVTFVPIYEGDKRVEGFYVATVNDKDATFVAAGNDLRGMPPGKYRVAIQLERRRGPQAGDQLKGKFNTENSPFVFDVDRGTKEIVIDLAKPPS